jgi:capsular exopolysaccharide synthesis family protein
VDRGDTPTARSLARARGFVRRRGWIVAVCLLLTTLAAVAYSSTREKVYGTSASLLFRKPGFDQQLFGSSLFSAPVDPAREAQTNLKLVSLDTVADRTAKALRNYTPDQIASHIDVAGAGQSDVVTITALASTPREAAQLATEYGRQYVSFRQRADQAKIAQAQSLVERRLSALADSSSREARSLRQLANQLTVLTALQTGNAELVQPAEDGRVVSPQPLRTGVLAAFLGLLLGLGLAWLRDRVDRRIREVEELEDLFDKPILGTVPESRDLAISGVDTIHDMAPSRAEPFQMLRANLRYFDAARNLRSVLLTSGGVGDGKSTVAFNLALAAARSGTKTILVEVDLRRSTLASRLGLPARQGLSQVLAGTSRRDDAIETLPIPMPGRDEDRALDVFAAGPIPPNPSELLESTRMAALLESFETDYELVVLDAPPLPVVSDPIPLLGLVGGVLVVARVGKTERGQLRQLRDQLDNLRAPVLGLVVNSVSERSSGYEGYYTAPQEAALAS